MEKKEVNYFIVINILYFIVVVALGYVLIQTSNNYVQLSSVIKSTCNYAFITNPINQQKCFALTNYPTAFYILIPILVFLTLFWFHYLFKITKSIYYTEK